MALYRKYRPATFAEVVGQEQVTTPLSAALDTGRINHAYLFSGPRGCGKTSSARIMARSLNCVQGPTSTPCGECPSCVSLAPGGPGNLDVTELDAASHNGVEDMRELRDRAYYAPAESRYRIFIIDEAHMISNAGSNALLKVVEEPPEHLIFIFATTEPEKVIGTIRSRTHHYPFRLLTPSAMKGLLERTVASENVAVDEAVYPMVIQAGGGSPRDTLSILDQLLAGAGPEGLTYDIARPLLGVTDVTLIDDTIAALADRDKAALFTIVGHVIEAGHEPRRFAVDLLDRLRDLMVLQAVPDAIDAGLVDAPANRAEPLAAQAQRFHGAQLANFAATVNEQIGGLRGATSPRLLLEILCAHLIVGEHSAAPAAGPADQGPSAQPLSPQAATASAPATSGEPGTTSAASQQSGSQSGGVSATSPDAHSGAAAAAAAAAAIAARRGQAKQKNEGGNKATPTTPAAAETAHKQAAPEQQVPEQNPPEVQETQPAQATAQPAPEQAQQAPTNEPDPAEAPAQPEKQEPVPQPAGSGGPSASDPEALAESIRSEWATLRVNVGKHNKVAEIMLTEARVLGIEDSTLVLGHTTGALAERLNVESNNAPVAQVVSEFAGTELSVKCVIGTNPAAAGFSAPSEPRPTWNPNQGKADSSDDDDQESESRSPQASSETSPPAAEAAAETSAPGWGTPRALGGDDNSEKPRESSSTPAQQSSPAVPEVHAPPAPATSPTKPNEPSSKPDWRERIAQATSAAKQREAENVAAGAFSDGVPLPPEPGPDPGFDGPAPEDNDTAYRPNGAANGAVPDQPSATPPQSAPATSRDNDPAAAQQEEEERLIKEAAEEEGVRDKRSATEVAMELLSQELGARRL